MTTNALHIPLHTVYNAEDGLEANVYTTTREDLPYAVTLTDDLTDAGETLPTIHLYKTIEEAIASAEKAAGSL